MKSVTRNRRHYSGLDDVRGMRVTLITFVKNTLPGWQIHTRSDSFGRSWPKAHFECGKGSDYDTEGLKAFGKGGL